MATPSPVVLSPDGRELPALLGALAARPGRLLGLSGAPGAGKSTLAAALVALWPGSVAVPMDGFHLADVELARRGLMSVKGAPATFDAEGYAALLARVRGRSGTVMAPSFDRDLEQPLAGAIPVPADASLVVTEGNYLLLPDGPWPAVRAELDAVWQVRLDEDVRRARLVARHVRFGKTETEARAWVARVDEPHAELVRAAAGRADLVLDLSQWQG